MKINVQGIAKRIKKLIWARFSCFRSFVEIFVHTNCNIGNVNASFLICAVNLVGAVAIINGTISL